MRALCPGDIIHITINWAEGFRVGGEKEDQRLLSEAYPTHTDARVVEVSEQQNFRGMRYRMVTLDFGGRKETLRLCRGDYKIVKGGKETAG